MLFRSVLASLTPEGRSTSTNTLNFVSLRASRDLMKLGGGNLALGTGLEFTKRSLDEHFPDGFASGAQASNIYAFGVGKQTISAAYVELAAPITKQLEIDAAARIDHYDTYGSSATPKVGVGLWPAAWLLGTSLQPWPRKGEIDIMEMGGRQPAGDRKSTRLNSSHSQQSRMPSSA